MKPIVLSLFVGFLFVCCKSNHSELPEIVLSLNASEMQLKVSDLADQIRFVPLETNDSSLLPGNFNILMGRKYILALGMQEIQQFDRDGKHIRRLAVKGRGPGEFQNYYSAAMDDKNEFLYLSEWNNLLTIFDLKNGEFLGRKKLPLPIGKILQIDEDTLICQSHPQPGDTARYILCRITLDGNILNGIPSRHVGREFEDASCYRLPGGEFRLQSYRGDSLYTVRHFRQEPYATLKCSNNDDLKYTLNIIPYFENSRFHLMNVVPLYLERNENGRIVAATRKSTSRFYVDKREYVGKIISELYIDTLGIALPVNMLSLSDDIVCPLKAYELKKMAAEQVRTGNISPALRALDETIRDEDNPVLIVGKCKP